MPPYPVVAAKTPGHDAARRRRAWRVVIALWLAVALVSPARVGAQASPPPGKALPQPAGTSAARPDSAPQGARRDTAQDSAQASPVTTADSAQRRRAADSARAADSLRAAAARRGLLGDLSLVQAIVAVALVILAVILAIAALKLFERYGEMVGRDESLGVTNHWGGFGGGASGWRASPALALLLGALLLLGGATTVAVSVVGRVLPADGKAPPPAATAKGNTPAN